MKFEDVNVAVEKTVREMFSEMFYVEVDAVKNEDISEVFMGKNVVVNISVLGDLEGSVFLSIDNDVAKVLAEKLFGVEVDDDPGMCGSVFSELLNMVVGNLITNLEVDDPSVEVAIGPPVNLISESSVAVWLNAGSRGYRKTFEVAGVGELDICLCLKE